MDVLKKFTTGFALGALALGLTSVPARAESMLTGSFELPAAAYWGDQLLQPGQYTIQMTSDMHAVAHVPVFRLSGEGVNASFLAIGKPERETGRNYLDVVQIDGTYVIRAFDVGTLGESFAFGVTKSVKNKAVRASAQPVMTVPVSTE